KHIKFRTLDIGQEQLDTGQSSLGHEIVDRDPRHWSHHTVAPTAERLRAGGVATDTELEEAAAGMVDIEVARADFEVLRVGLDQVVTAAGNLVVKPQRIVAPAAAQL